MTEAHRQPPVIKSFLSGAVVLWMLCISSPAEAHKLKVFAAVVGPGIEGTAYFSPGGKARQVRVSLLKSDGIEIGQTTTDEDGNFHFLVMQREALTIAIDAGDGHSAQASVAAADFPDSLPTATPVAPSQQPTSGSITKPLAAMIDGNADIRAYIDQSLSRQLLPLREQIDAYQEKIWWHDVMGGLGTIFGISGIAFALAERRKRRPPPDKAS